MRRYVVRPDDPRTVAQIVAKAGGDAGAIAAGRVFVGRTRATSGTARVEPGDEVRVADVEGESPPVALLHADDSLVIVAKPAGVSTIPDHAGATAALITIAAKLVGAEASSLHPTSRLDREVSGVVVFARTRDAARALEVARERGSYVRRYVAIATRAPIPEGGVWDAPIGRAKDPRKRAARGRDPIHAQTRFTTVAVASGAALLALAPVTGRTHQLRVHAADSGAPLLGDRAYGGPARVTLDDGRVLSLERVALHCAHVQVHAAELRVDVRAPVPPELLDVWSALGGEAEAWDRGATCAL